MEGADPDTGEVTWEAFKDTLQSVGMSDYFRTIGVDPLEAEGLFHLLDVDRTGELDHTEIVSGLLRLRGNAKALELALLSHDLRTLHDQIAVYEAEMKFVIERR